MVGVILPTACTVGNLTEALERKVLAGYSCPTWLTYLASFWQRSSGAVAVPDSGSEASPTAAAKSQEPADSSCNSSLNS